MSPAERAPIRVLIADDHPILRDGLSRLLENEAGFQVVGQASDGSEAVRLARELLTVAIEDAQIREALQLGARGVVLKEAATELLFKTIRSVMAGSPPASARSAPASPWASRTKEIATHLGLSEITVKHHVSNVFDKLGVSNRAEHAVYATTRGLAQQPTSPSPRTSRLLGLPEAILLERGLDLLGMLVGVGQRGVNLGQVQRRRPRAFSRERTAAACRWVRPMVR